MVVNTVYINGNVCKACAQVASSLQMITYHNPVPEETGGMPHSLFPVVPPKPYHSLGSANKIHNFL
jgi:hypothetical protein